MYRIARRLCVLLGAVQAFAAVPGDVLAAAAAPVTAAAPAPAPLTDVRQLDSRKLTSDPETWPGAQVYREHCAVCHEGQVPKAPHKMFLQMMAPDSILAALTSGIMAEQGRPLTPATRRLVSEYLAGQHLEALRSSHPAPVCTGKAARFDLGQLPAAVGWGHDNSRFIPADVAQLSREEVPRLELKWAFAFPQAIRARSQPAIAYGAVYVGSQDGTVYALDLATGCVRWSYRASAEVRTAIVLAGRDDRAGEHRLFFGDVIGHLYSLDALTGKPLWRVKVDEHPNATLTATPTLYAGVLYVPISSLEVTTAADPKYACCTFRGSVVALDAASGAIHWRTYSIDEQPRITRRTRAGTAILAPSGAPVWNSPTIDAARGVLYVGTGENYSTPANDRSDAILAVRLRDGKLLWSRQMSVGDAWNVACMMKDNPNCPVENGPDADFGAGTILVRLSGTRDLLVAGQKNGVVYALDPDGNGRLLWKRQVGRGGVQGGIHFGMAAADGRVFAPVADLRDGHDGRTYDAAPRPGLYALDAATGRLIWSVPAVDSCAGRAFCDPGISAAATAIPGVVFAGHMDGTLRAYDARDGRVLWQFDAAREFRTVSGATGRGGSFGGAGPAVRAGYLVVNSGYGLYFHMPGNVLLAFAVRKP